MNGLRSCAKTGKPSPQGRFFRFARQRQRGNALLYVLLAVGLLAALTYYYVQDSNENYSSQQAIHISEELYSQINMIRAAIVQCTLEYPAGGGDMNGDGVVNSSDNPNNPYPINPSSNLNSGRKIYEGGSTVSDPIAPASNDDISNLTCVGAPSAYAYMFSGTNNQGRYLPPPPSEFTSQWVYSNNVSGVSISIQVPSDLAAVDAANRLLNKFSGGQATFSSSILTIWLKQ